MAEFTCMFCKDHPVVEDNMICEHCAENEIEAEERDGQYAAYHEKLRLIRYDGIKTFDNEVGKISVVYRHKVLCTWNNNVVGHLLEQARRDALLEAKSYIEGWCDAAAVAKRVVI